MCKKKKKNTCKKKWMHAYAARYFRECTSKSEIAKKKLFLFLLNLATNSNSVFYTHNNAVQSGLFVLYDVYVCVLLSL